jgi:hypothetical protein
MSLARILEPRREQEHEAELAAGDREIAHGGIVRREAPLRRICTHRERPSLGHSPQ